MSKINASDHHGSHAKYKLVHHSPKIEIAIIVSCHYSPKSKGRRNVMATPMMT